MLFGLSEGETLDIHIVEKLFSEGLLRKTRSEGFILSNGYSKKKGIEKGIEKTADKIVGIMRENSEITIADIASILELSKPAINKQIANLKKNNKIKRVGGRKGGYWLVME